LPAVSSAGSESSDSCCASSISSSVPPFSASSRFPSSTGISTASSSPAFASEAVSSSSSVFLLFLFSIIQPHSIPRVRPARPYAVLCLFIQGLQLVHQILQNPDHLVVIHPFRSDDTDRPLHA